MYCELNGKEFFALTWPNARKKHTVFTGIINQTIKADENIY